MGSGVFSSSIGRKFVMGLTGLFLITFIKMHLMINFFSVFSKDLFNEASHFMGTNPVIQTMQYVLALGFLFHIIMGIRLTIQNSKARPVAYAKNDMAANSVFSSRYMIHSGLLVMVFIFLHIKDFFVPIKFARETFDTDYDLMKMVFESPIYVIIYVVAFVALAIHLHHGFQSAFQTIGVNHPKYTPFLKLVGKIFCVVVGAGFSIIALYHHFM